MYKTWEELTVLEQMACTFSDMYKDAWGCRPRMDTSEWTVEDFEQEFDILQEVIKKEEQRLAERERQSIARFEQRVADAIQMGARDRETAIRWIVDSEGAEGDALCYTLGLPYNYFSAETLTQ